MLKEFIVISTSLFLFHIIFTDIKFRKIYNIDCFLIFLFSLWFSFLVGCDSVNLLFFFSGFFILYCGWFSKIIGGGDVKLISALFLFFSPKNFVMFSFCVSLFGFFIAVICIIVGKSRIFNKKNASVPYGVAIALGFFVEVIGDNLR